MLFKRVLLTIISAFVILLFLSSEFYGTWFSTKIWTQKDALDEQMEHMGLNERTEMRFGKTYLAIEQMLKVLKEAKDTNPIILLPPNGYVRDHENIHDFIIPEPSQFYYFTGMHAVWTSSPDVKKATWALIIENKNMRFVKIENQQMLEQLLTLYKGYNTV